MSKVSAERTFDLPMPPSLWKLYKGNGPKKHKTKEYRSWITEAGWMLMHQRNLHGRFKRFTGNVEVIIRAYKPGSKRRDLDNILKPILDLLTSTQTIIDDSYVVAIDARWVNEGTPCSVIVRAST